MIWYLRSFCFRIIAHNRSYKDPKIKDTAVAFDAAYSYLMLLLQNVWRIEGEEGKRDFVMGGMPALMHGVLKPIAILLAGK